MIARTSLITRILFLLAGCCFTPWASAATPTPMLPTPPAPALPAIVSYTLMDYDTGQIIAAKSENPVVMVRKICAKPFAIPMMCIFTRLPCRRMG